MRDITCVLPTYGDPIHVRRAVESALSQIGMNVKVLLLDDGSQESARQQLQALADTDNRIQFHGLTAHVGPAMARNLGAMLAQSPHICFLDPNDQHAPGWYQRGVDHLQEHTELGAVSGDAIFVDMPERLNIHPNDLRLRGLAFMFVTNMIFCRSVFLALGGFPVGDIWRNRQAGDDGAFRRVFIDVFRGAHVNVPALVHSAQEGSATVRFLDRTRVEKQRVVFLDDDKQELSLAHTRYAKQCQSNIKLLRAALQFPPPREQLMGLHTHLASEWELTNNLEQYDMPHRVNLPLSLFRQFQRVDPLCIKHTSYFQVYEKILRPYVGKPITFVEVGVFNGGSLALWRAYLGPKARIIGIDTNPRAKRWESEGFEIFIGDQASHVFWQSFYAEVGPVDVLLDDGGHLSLQQIVTAQEAMRHLRDGGTLIVEDVHTSYLPAFGNPSEDSFINHAKRAIDDINARFPHLPEVNSSYRQRAWSVSFYESIVVIYVDSRRCFESQWISNNGIVMNDPEPRPVKPKDKKSSS